jgi:hypothetical protein
MAPGDALSIFHSEAVELPPPASASATLDAPAVAVETPGRERYATSEGVELLTSELGALTVAVENLTLWTIGMSMLIGALACATFLRLS